jgi:hypothetical protein
MSIEAVKEASDNPIEKRKEELRAMLQLQQQQMTQLREEYLETIGRLKELEGIVINDPSKKDTDSNEESQTKEGGGE